MKSGHYGHCSNNNERKDENKSDKHKPDMGCRDCKEKEITSYLTVDVNPNYNDCSEKEQSDNGGRVGCKGHKGDKRSKCWREPKTLSFCRGRSMSREKSSNLHNFMKFRWKTCRHGRRRSTHRRNNRSIGMPRSSSEESGCQLFDGLQVNCNSTVKCDSTIPIDESEKQRQMLHSACKYVTKHDYCQCCHGNIPCRYNIIPSCHSRKRKHKHYSSESDEATTKVGRISDCVQHEHANGCQGKVLSSCHSVCWGMSCKDCLFCLDGAINPKCKNFINERRCTWSALGSQRAGYYVQSQDFRDIGDVKTISKPKEGSSDIYRKTSNLHSSCAGAKANFDAVKTEDQEDQDLWLELRLKTLQRSELKVEGASKNDLKLSLPDSSIELNLEVQVPSQLPNSGIHSSRDPIEHICDNELPLESSNILFSVWNPIVNPFSLPQRMEESIPCLSFMEAPVVVSDLNPADSSVNMVANSIPSIIEGKSTFSLDQNCHYSLTTTREPECAVLEESNLSSPGISEDKHHPISDLPIPANERNGLPPSLSISSYKEERRGLCLTDSQLKATRTSDATDCGVGNECDASELFQSEREKELSRLAIIVDDTEDDFSEHSYFHESPKGNNFLKSIGDIAVLKEVSLDGREDHLHKSKNNYVQNTSLAGSIFCSDMKEFDLECRKASLANAQRKDKVDNCANMRGISLSRSHRNTSECANSSEELAEDKCRTIEASSSEDEFVDNNVDNVTLACKNKILQERGCYTLVGCITTRGTDNMIPSDQEKFGHKDNDNFKFVGSGDEVLLSDIRLQKKLEFSPKDENGNSEAVCSSRGIPSTLDPKLLNMQYVEALIQIAYSKPRMWDTGINCDLCGQGPSLIYGDWYAWCCGYRLCHCKCSKDHQRKLKLSMDPKNKKPSKRCGRHHWSGKVHRLCGLWSSEVFEKDDAKDKLEGLLHAGKRGKEMIFEKDDGKDKLEGLFDAVKRGKFLDCKDPECRRFGATLGCRVKNCRRSFHYPCAVKLASQLHCRMWEGCRRPVACYSHRHVDHDCVSAKNWKPHWFYGNKIVNPGKRNRNTAICYTETCQPHQNMTHNCSIIQDFNLNSVVQKTIEENEGRNASGIEDKTVNHEENKLERDAATLSRMVLDGNTLEFIGQKLICEDLSHGKEAIKVPCTNDVDDAPPPSLEYITSSKFSVEADAILKIVLANVKKQAKPCTGCYKIEIDDPKASISAHVDVNEGGRHQDRRIDWQGEPMLGRLPYDCYGLLQLGWLTIDLVECNSRCCCGSKCINRELQKGLQLALEVFKTKDRGWGVRTLEQIPRGKFVMEYVGEVLTQVEASKRGQLYAEYNSSYLCNLDHPTVAQEDNLVIDGFKMSNVARFINHSCEGNLRLYRVYTETLDPRIFRIGLYACRDVEIGEELTYDYKYVQEEPSVDSADKPSAVKCFCQAKNCRQVLLSG
ncbi:hypothetical protein SUGI_0394410 [Cryptomeria japonica]|nr:hypothetical protein SUGI_0394410 [Cryptomeria japonica]